MKYIVGTQEAYESFIPCSVEESFVDAEKFAEDFLSESLKVTEVVIWEMQESHMSGNRTVWRKVSAEEEWHSTTYGAELIEEDQQRLQKWREREQSRH